MNAYLSDELTRIDRDYSDPALYAQSYSEYLSNQTAVLQEMVNATMEFISSVEADDLPVDYDYVVGQLNTAAGDDVVLDFVQTGNNVAQVLPTTLDGAVAVSAQHAKADEIVNSLKPYWSSSMYSQTDGTIIPFSEFAKAAYLNANDVVGDATKAIANGMGKLSSLDTILADVKTQINEQMALTTALDLLKEEATDGVRSSLSDFYSALNLKAADLSREGIVSSLKSYVISDFGNVKSRVFSLIDSISTAGQNSDDNIDETTVYVPGTMDLSGYTGVSAATVGGTLNAGPFKKVVKTVGTALKGAIGATVAILKAGFKKVKSLAKKYIAPAVSNPVFIQNADYQVDSVDQPIFSGYIYESSFWPLAFMQTTVPYAPPFIIKKASYDITDFDSYLTVSDIINTMSGGADFGSFIKTAFKMFGDTAPHYALHMRYMFFDLYFSLTQETTVDAKDGVVYLEVYPVPTSYANLPSFMWSWTHKPSDSTKYSVLADGNPRSLKDIISRLYPEDPSEVEISAEDISGTVKTDLSMIKCCVASAYRTMAYAQLRMLANMPGFVDVTLIDATSTTDATIGVGDYIFLGNTSGSTIPYRPKVAAIPITVEIVGYTPEAFPNEKPGARYPLVFSADNPYSGVPASEEIDCENIAIYLSNSEGTGPNPIVEAAGLAGKAKPANWAWFATHMDSVTGDVTNTSFWKFAAETSVPQKRLLAFATTDDHNYAAISSSGIFMVAMLFSIVSNKREYMKNVYLKSQGQSWPLFIPYERVSQRLRPRYHIKSDKEIKTKADAIVTAAVTAVIALLATAAAAYFGFKVKGKVKMALAKTSNDAQSKRKVYQDMLTAQREGDKTVYDTVTETVDGKVITKTVPRVIKAPSQEDVNRAFKDYKKTQKKANRIAKIADKLGVKDWTGTYKPSTPSTSIATAENDSNELISLVKG